MRYVLQITWFTSVEAIPGYTTEVRQKLRKMKARGAVIVEGDGPGNRTVVMLNHYPRHRRHNFRPTRHRRLNRICIISVGITDEPQVD